MADRVVTGMIMINVALDMVGLSVIATLMLGALLTNQTQEKRGRIYLLLLALIAAQQVCDAVNWLLEGKAEHAQWLLFVNFCIFTSAEITALVFYHYVLCLISRSGKKLRQMTIVLSVLCFVAIALNVFNLTNEAFYGVDENGRYFRGPLYLLTHVYHFVVMLIGVVLALMEKDISLRYKLALFSYAFLPLVAVAFQLMFYGLSSLTYCAMMLSTLLIYITVHVRNMVRLEKTDEELNRTRQAYLETLYDAENDDLTGTSVRKVLVRQVEDALAARRKNGCSLWMVDLDLFKEINDRFGHAMGDKALQMVAKHLLSVFPEGTAVARYGGDEFCLFFKDVTLAQTYQHLQRAISVLHFTIRDSEDAARRAEVSVSIGAAFAAPGRRTTCEELFRQADEALYVSKNDGKHQYTLREMT